MEIPHRTDLVLGIDGGGTGTRALLARRGSGDVLGQASAGPSNIQSVGVAAALGSLDAAVDAVFAAAAVPRSTVSCACLGLAGIDRKEGLDIIHEWAKQVALAESLTVANDATLLLAAGTPDGWGLAVISGTGSIAFVRTPTGEIGRCGGWGYTLGDEGSAYQIAVQAMRSACRSYDGVLQPTVLLDRFLKRMNLREPPELIPAVYRGPWDRAAIAGMAPIVLEAAAEGDALALEIVRLQAEELARTAATAVRNINLVIDGLPVALAGGVLLGSETYRRFLLGSLRDLGLTPGNVQLVEDPAVGAVVLARRAAVDGVS